MPGWRNASSAPGLEQADTRGDTLHLVVEGFNLEDSSGR